MNFWKSYFLLPNLFTLANIYCGFYAVSLCGRLGEEGVDNDSLYKAAIAICFGLFFDATDGRIARLTETQSELGLNLDSLADVVTFGMAPALLIYRWGLEDLGRAGLIIAFVFLGCAALRLARFNILAVRDDKKIDKYMLGLPTPVSACAIVSVILVTHTLGIHGPPNDVVVAVMVVILGYLMISRIHFRSLKDLKMNRRTLATAALILGLATVAAIKISQPAMLLVLVGLYIALGLAEELVFLRQRFAEYRAARKAGQTEAAAEEAGMVAEEHQVLAELGMEE